MVQVCALLESVALWHSTGGGGLGWAQSTIISQFSHTNTIYAYPVTSALLSFSVFSAYATVRPWLNHAPPPPRPHASARPTWSSKITIKTHFIV